MEIKETVKTKLVKVKDEAAKIAVAVAPYITIGVASGAIVYITAKASYNIGWGRGFVTGTQNGKKAVIEIINDLAKSVETK